VFHFPSISDVFCVSARNAQVVFCLVLVFSLYSDSMGPYGSLTAPLHVADVTRVVPCLGLAAGVTSGGSSKAANDQAIRSCGDWRVALKLLHLGELRGGKLETWWFQKHHCGILMGGAQIVKRRKSSSSRIVEVVFSNYSFRPLPKTVMKFPPASLVKTTTK